jgi:chromodomain-helicase-DNA-binding protein 1
MTLIWFRTYVAGFWPLDPSPPASQLEGMYKKILKAENEKPASASGTPTANGTSSHPTPVARR